MAIRLAIIHLRGIPTLLYAYAYAPLEPGRRYAPIRSKTTKFRTDFAAQRDEYLCMHKYVERNFRREMNFREFEF